MLSRFVCRLVACRFVPALLVLASLANSPAQTITSSIRGTVSDASGLAIAGADVSATQTTTGAVRSVKTDDRGEYFFSGLEPGTYDILIAASGFKRLEQHLVQLSAAETLATGKVTLEIGAVADAVTIASEVATVQVASSERSGLISDRQLDNLLTKSRNVMSLISLLPGVYDNQSLGNADFMDRNFDLYVQGNRRNTNSVSLDGMTTNPIGNNFNTSVTVSQDAVAEVKVLLTNYAAEYGRSSGASINVVTKSGTKDFHGLFSYFKRHEQFNANNFFNNRNSQPKPRYRYNTYNYNVGGPVYIPGKWNRNKDKLFVFWSQEFWPLKGTSALSQLTVPTALERSGDFSQSVDLNGKLIPVIDPVTKQAFPGNIIPPSRLDPSGRALLNVFPQANYDNRAISSGRYNYQFQADKETPVHLENLKLDYLFTPSHTLSFTFANFLDHQIGALGIATTSGNWQQLKKDYRLNGQGFILRYTGVLSPTLINQLSLGFTRRPESSVAADADIAKNTRSVTGYLAAQLNPSSNPLNLIPNATFGGVTNAASLSLEGRFPFNQQLNAFNLTENLTKTIGAHTLKAGIFIERNYQGSNADGQYAGNISFANDVNNPLNSGYAYSNAALGVFSTYTEASNRVFLHGRQHSVEYFVQDNWRATKRLTLDLGVRIQHIIPIYFSNDKLSSFSASLYSPGQAVKLIQPALVNNVRVGVSPVSGTVYPAALIRAIAPDSGNAADGIGVAGQNGYPRSLIDTYSPRFSPRVGFAWDVFGNSKTAVRGGFGTFYNRPNFSDNIGGLFATQLPLVSNPTIYYSSLSNLTASTGALFPQSVNGFDRSDRIPKTMNFSFGVQQNIGLNTIVEASYVGSLGRNLLWRRNLNPIPLNANFQTANLDPTSPGKPLSAAFLRPLTGYNDIYITEPASSSSYHSLQVSAQRRLSRDLQFGLAWTWSRSMDFNDFDTDIVSSQVDPRIYNYSVSGFDRTHVVKVNWVYDFPKHEYGFSPLRVVLNDWQLSGIATFISGAPLAISYSTVNSVDFTGTSTLAARIRLLGDPVLPSDQRTFDRNFNTDMVALPLVGTIGNAGRYQIRGPGVNNFDLSLFKTFKIHERARIQFRAEAYNAFNHTQFSAIDTAARFDAAGKQVNASLGAFTAARNPRIMQFALRFSF